MLVTTTDGAVLAGANSDETYSGDSIGFWTPFGIAGIDGPLRRTRRLHAAELRKRAIEYAKDHPGRAARRRPPRACCARTACGTPTALVDVAADFHGQGAWFAWLSLRLGAAHARRRGGAAYAVARAPHAAPVDPAHPRGARGDHEPHAFGDARFRVALDVSLACWSPSGSSDCSTGAGARPRELSPPTAVGTDMQALAERTGSQ